MRLLSSAFAAVLLLLAGAAFGQDIRAERAVTISAEPVALYPDDPDRTDLDALIYRGGLVLSSDDPAFGGFSAIGMSEDGTRLIAVSDRGHWLTADLVYGEDDAPIALENARMAPLLSVEGLPLRGRMADAEGLAYQGDGVWLVSFERDHRVKAYAIGTEGEFIGTAIPERLAHPPGAENFADNGSLEALAVQSGFAWVGVEYPSLDGTHTVIRYDLARPSEKPDVYAIRLTPGFGLVAFAELGEGGLIAVERFWQRDIGNRIRISRISEAAIIAPVGQGEVEWLALMTPDMTVDNMEGAAVVTREGRQRLFLISDDNYSARQRTLLMSFDLPE